MENALIFDADTCSDFVRAVVLPLLGGEPSVVMTRETLRSSLQAWLTSLPEIELACDSMHDRDLVMDLLDYQEQPNVTGWINLNSLPSNDLQVFRRAEAANHNDPSRPWHHALNDAMGASSGMVFDQKIR